MPTFKDFDQKKESAPETYFSERVEGETPRENEEINDSVWSGIQALIQARIDDGSFGAKYPITCSDGGGIVGTNEGAFEQAMQADIPNLQEREDNSFLRSSPWNKKPQRTLDILDMVEFCWRCIGKPIRKEYHEHFKHQHLDFDIEAGQDGFRDDINRIFRRNGLAYELTEHGHIERLAPPVLREELASDQFRTSDAELDGMLEKARCKFLNLIKLLAHPLLNSERHWRERPTN